MMPGYATQLAKLLLRRRAGDGASSPFKIFKSAKERSLNEQVADSVRGFALLRCKCFGGSMLLLLLLLFQQWRDDSWLVVEIIYMSRLVEKTSE